MRLQANALLSIHVSMIILEIEATITKRGRTIVPAAIRKALHVGSLGGTVYRLEDSGQVNLVRKEQAEACPIISNFLTFLSADVMARSDAPRPVTTEWADELQDLVKGVEFDLDAPLSEDDDQ